MRAGTFFLLATAGAIFHIYTEGKYWNMLMTHKKYVQIAAVAMAGLTAYYAYKSLSSSRKYEFTKLANEYLSNGGADRIDKLAPKIHPVLDMTAANQFHREMKQSTGGGPTPFPVLDVGGGGSFDAPSAEIDGQRRRALSRIMNSGWNPSGKRSVSAAKKKYVASSQNWRCANCRAVLSAYFEVDHIKRVADGGSNHVSNLRALCAECHRHKTAQEMARGGSAANFKGSI